MGRQLNVSSVLYAELHQDHGTVFIRRDWTAAGVATLAGQTITTDYYSPEDMALLRSGQTVVNNDVMRDGRTAEHAATFAEIGVRANLLVPFVKAGRLSLVLMVQNAAPRVWHEHERRLVQETAGRTWSAVEALQAQTALRSERDQSQYIFDAMAEGFAVLDRDWTILRMNAEGLRLTQKSPAEVIGRNHWDVWPELKGSDSEAIYRRVMETGKTELIENRYFLPGGRQAWMEVRTYRSLYGGIAFFFRDITERKLAQEQLKIADRRKDEFLAMLAHELRNPLAPIGAAAQLLQRPNLDQARVRLTSQIIGRQVDHMTHLINDLLDVSRVTRGLVTLDKAPHNIRHIVAEAVEQATPLIQSRRHHLSLHLPPDTTMVEGDKNRLVQVFTNILNNAAKYTNAGGNIMLRTDVHQSNVQVEVIDDGIGMSPDLSAHVFELFAQAERTPDRSAGGLGLGLALVKSLVELHAGTVRCHSDGVGTGSTFTVCLPRLSVPDNREPRSYIDDALGPRARSLRILIVDDNVDAASMLAMLLESSGHTVMVEHRGQEGLVRAKAERPEVCLLDIGLPGMDGTALARALRELPETADSVLIAVTGYGQESDRERILTAGFEHHLVKPLDMSTLFSILEQL